MTKAKAALGAILAISIAGAVVAPPGAAAGELIVVSPYEGYIYGPLPYGPLPAQGAFVTDERYQAAPRANRHFRIKHAARVRRVTRILYSFDPDYGGGPFYHRHPCCRYW
jgi:hypothetical protein